MKEVKERWETETGTRRIQQVGKHQSKEMKDVREGWETEPGTRKNE